VRDLVLAEADVVQQSQGQVFGLHHARFDPVFFVPVFQFKKLIVEGFVIGECQAFFHRLSSIAVDGCC
jgi:hypothetical protein